MKLRAHHEASRIVVPTDGGVIGRERCDSGHQPGVTSPFLGRQPVGAGAADVARRVESIRRPVRSLKPNRAAS